MKDNDLWAGIERAVGLDFKIEKEVSLLGGSINAAYKIEGRDRTFFVKLNKAERLHMFEAECDGLREIVATETVRVPQPVAHGIAKTSSFLILEWLKLGAKTSRSDRIMGEQLAAMHRKPQTNFGWFRDNTIGSTLQKNNRSDNWIGFWRDHRLGFQLEHAELQGVESSLIDSGALLADRISALFAGYSPKPSLLHGDLWSGNAASDNAKNPVIFDPACYCGDREADIAMTELFGGFSADFYAAYALAWPLDPGYQIRKTLYNLYHVLNHFNLFGGGYQRQAKSMIQMLLAELG